MIEEAIKFQEELPRLQLIVALLSLYEEEKYPLAKSVGSIGGAITQNFILYNQSTDTYTRIKK